MQPIDCEYAARPRSSVLKESDLNLQTWLVLVLDVFHRQSRSFLAMLLLFSSTRLFYLFLSAGLDEITEGAFRGHMWAKPSVQVYCLCKSHTISGRAKSETLHSTTWQRVFHAAPSRA